MTEVSGQAGMDVSSQPQGSKTEEDGTFTEVVTRTCSLPQIIDITKEQQKRNVKLNKSSVPEDFTDMIKIANKMKNEVIQYANFVLLNELKYCDENKVSFGVYPRTPASEKNKLSNLLSRVYTLLFERRKKENIGSGDGGVKISRAGAGR